MGCGSCGTASGGKPSGCKSNGGCSTGGCNRLNVYDWLNDLPLHDGAKPYQIIEVSFNKGSRKEFFRNNTNYILEKNHWVTVEGVSGIDLGQVSLTGELVKLQMKKYSVTENSITKRVLHPATDEEILYCESQKNREQEIMVRARAISKTLKLEMKICEVEVQADGKKGTFFYTADQRVDFRELIKLFAGDFKMKIEMRQIGARQESGKVGGIGSCGRELCCSTWLSDFKSVNTTAARYQNLSINQAKLSGQCGRLKCCLNYELDTYLDALSVFPDHADHLDTVKGTAHLQKRDIFKNLMWYSYSDNNKQYPLSIVRVKEILKLNKLGQKADDLQPVELEVKPDKQGNIKTDMGFMNDVGQSSLKNLEKGNKKKKPNKNQSRDKTAVEGQIKDPQAPRDPMQARPENRQNSGNNSQQGKPQRPNHQQGQRPERRQNATGTEAVPEGQGATQPQRRNRGNNPHQRPERNANQEPRKDREATNEPNSSPSATEKNQEPGGNQDVNAGQQRRDRNPNQQRTERGPRPERNPDQATSSSKENSAEKDPNQPTAPKQHNKQRNDRRGNDRRGDRPKGDRPPQSSSPVPPSTPTAE